MSENKKYYIEMLTEKGGKLRSDNHGKHFPTFKDFFKAVKFVNNDYKIYWKTLNNKEKNQKTEYHIISEEKHYEYDPIVQEEGQVTFSGLQTYE